MSKIDVGVGQEFPVETDEREREQRERERREREERVSRDDNDDYSCGGWRDWREARDEYRRRYREQRRHWRHRHWRHGPGGYFFFPRIIFIALSIALIVFAVSHPLTALIIGGIIALIVMNRRHGFLREVARDIRQGWDGDDTWQSPRNDGPSNGPRPNWDAPASGSAQTQNNNSNPSSGAGTAGSPV